jgi:hypothetical protein
MLLFALLAHDDVEIVLELFGVVRTVLEDRRGQVAASFAGTPLSLWRIRSEARPACSARNAFATKKTASLPLPGRETGRRPSPP